MGIIKVTGIKCNAYHGCLAEEALTGTTFITNVTLVHDFERAARYDDLELTIDYCSVALIVQQEMQLRAKLIESVGQRILGRIKQELRPTGLVTVEIEKLNAPIQGEVEKVIIEICG